MKRHGLLCDLLRPTNAWAIGVALLANCGTGPDLERLPDGLYVTDYDPPPITSAVAGCDRLLSRVYLIITSRGSFELSINVIDDCTRSGEGFSYVAIDRNGGYYIDGNDLTFVPNTGAPAFPGALDGQYIRLRLPPDLELATAELEVRVGPRSDP